MLADTVGFISRLPHELVAAFRATLRETCEASLLLHVIDASHPDRDGVIAQVEAVLAEIGAADVPQLQVFNKIDLSGEPPRLERDAEGQARAVWLSAATGAGLDFSARRRWPNGCGARRCRAGCVCRPRRPGCAPACFSLGAVVAEQTGPTVNG